MRYLPNTLLTSLLAAASCLASTSPALAQQARPGEVMGMRYLSWSGKAAAPADGLRRSSGPTAAPIPVAADNARYPGVQMASARPSRYGAGSTGLTPASVWTGQELSPPPASTIAPPAAPAPRTAQQPDPAVPAQSQADYQAQVQSEYQAWYQSQAQAQYEAQVRARPQPRESAMQVPAAETSPQTQMAQQAPTQQQTPSQYQQQADAGPPPGYDPMAPRRDAAIFRMQQRGQDGQPLAQPAQQRDTSGQPTAATQAEIQQPVLTQPAAGRTYSGQAYAGAEPPRESARYYSVHRAEGRQPDPIAMPESVYLDNAPIDLAEPPAAPVPSRTINGRAQVIVSNQDPTLP